MKSFAERTRDGLTRGDDFTSDTLDTRRAELTGLALTCGSITLLGGGATRLTMRTIHAGTARWIVRLSRHGFAITPGLRIHKANRLGGRTTYEARVEGEDAKRLIAALGISPMERTIPRHCLKNRRVRDAFLRGAYLGSGTITDPERDYRLEFGLTVERTAEGLQRFLQTFYSLRAGLNRRKGMFVVYLKGGDDIITALSCIGAHSAILELENVRIMKDARNRANRAANCDSGNITKMLGASERQLEAIARIEQTIGLDALPDSLREVAVERKLHADISLEALGEMLEPPVGKSGVYHRLSRIEALARSIAQQEKEEQT